MLKFSTKSYFYCKHSKFGQLKFRKINLNDLAKIENYKVIRKRYKGFTIFLLHNQIVSPQISISDLSIIDNSEIISIAKYFIKEIGGLFAEYFKEKKNESFFLNFYNSFKKSREELSKSFVSLETEVAQLSKRFSELSSESFSRIAQLNIDLKNEYQKKIYEQIGKSMENFLKAVDDAGEILEKYEWLIPPSIDLRVAAFISNLGNKPGDHRKEINKLFWDIYREDNFKEIEEMITKWNFNKLFKKRIRILKNCLTVLQLSKKIGISSSANVIIPTLIAQIDGVWTDYVISKGFDINNYYAQHEKWEVSRELRRHRKEAISDFRTSDSFLKFDNLFKNMILETLWGTAYTKISPESGFIRTRFNRHKIMHGEYVSYGSKYNVLRAFFLLDFLSELK